MKKLFKNLDITNYTQLICFAVVFWYNLPIALLILFMFVFTVCYRMQRDREKIKNEVLNLVYNLSPLYFLDSLDRFNLTEALTDLVHDNKSITNEDIKYFSNFGLPVRTILTKYISTSKATGKDLFEALKLHAIKNTFKN